MIIRLNLRQCLIFIMFLTISCDQLKSGNTTDDVIEIRVVPKDGINIRVGPGTEFEKDASGTLVKGGKIYVISEQDNWVKFRLSKEDVGWHGWVRKDLTITIDEYNENIHDNNIASLKKQGILLSINPELNDAKVDPVVWKLLPFERKKEVGQRLAFYCGHKKGTNLNWVNINDYYSGKKLAKYSEATGFQNF